MNSAVVYITIMNPLRFGWPDEFGPEFDIIEKVIDCVFILDLILNFFTPYQDIGLNIIICHKVSPIILKLVLTLTLENSLELHQRDVSHRFIGEYSIQLFR